MSWHVEGRTYTNLEEYQRARADADKRKAERAAAELANENRRLLESIQRDRQSMDEVRNDVRKQMELSRRIDSNVSALQRNNQRLEEIVQQTERRMQDGLVELEKDLGGKIDQTRVDVGELRENHRRHVEETRRSLGELQAESRSGLLEAERRRRESEQRLNQSIQAVDQKVQDDRAERTRRTSDQRSLATGEISAAMEALARIERDKHSLDMAGVIQQASARLGSARTLLTQENVSAALAASTLARADAESAEMEAHSRRLEMDQCRTAAAGRIAWIENSIGSGASQDLKECYGLECARTKQMLEAARDRLANRYQNYRLLPAEAREDGDLLDRMETETLEMVASAPLAAEAAERRVQRLDEILAGLERVYGQMTSAEQRFSQNDDPKSDLVVNAVFGSSKVELRLALDGDVSVDGYGHGSASACAAAAHRVVSELQERTLVREVTKDAEDRSHPRLPGSRAPERSDLKRG